MVIGHCVIGVFLSSISKAALNLAVSALAKVWQVAGDGCCFHVIEQTRVHHLKVYEDDLKSIQIGFFQVFTLHVDKYCEEKRKSAPMTN